jgi:hypothetical protein
MRDELIVGYPTLEQAKQARRALLDEGVVEKSHITVAPARSFGPLRTRSEPSAALVGAVAGAALGVVLAVLMAFVGDVGGFGLGVVLVGIGAGVGAFIGGLSGLSFGQTDSTDLTEHMAHDGYIVRIDVDRPEQERAAARIFAASRAALLARDSHADK